MSNFESTPDQVLFESAFKHASIGMALISLEGKWLKVNQSACDFLGYTPSEFSKINFQIITHPDDLDADLVQFEKMIRGEIETYQIEKRYLTKNGKIVWAILSVSMIHNPDGSPKFFISQIQDITALKAAQEELQKNIKHATQWSMSSRIAHDVNNPLAIIALHTKALNYLIDDPEGNADLIRELTPKIGNAVERIMNIVNIYKNVTRPNISQEHFE